MRITDYENIIKETAVYPKQYGVAYTVLGLIEESVELYDIYLQYLMNDSDLIDEHLDIQVLKEAGDVLWYVTATLSELGMKLSDFVTEDLLKNNDDDTEVVILNAVNLAKVAKKYIRDNNLKQDILKYSIENIVSALSAICKQVGFSFEICMSTNYEKLIARRASNTIHGDGER